MLATTVDFADLLAAALIVGAMFAVWLIYSPAGVDAATYIAQQQHAIRGLNVALPVVGGVTVLLTILAAALALARHDRPRLVLLAIATALFIAGGLITRFANQPINATVMTWSPAAPPANWTKLRDDWWRWHVLRFAVATGGLCLVIAAALSRDPSA